MLGCSCSSYLLAVLEEYLFSLLYFAFGENAKQRSLKVTRTTYGCRTTHRNERARTIMLTTSWKELVELTMRMNL
uniref:Uncharacterized protein n=1 Tax=Ciona intestinalis TaxID=7719 RepID=H2XUM0_CIOIN